MSNHCATSLARGWAFPRAESGLAFARRQRGLITAGRLALLLSLLLTGTAIADDGSKKFEMSATQRLTYDGALADPRHVQRRFFEFGIIPTRTLSIDVWLNPVTGKVEQTIKPAIPYPVPVLRASHVRLFEKAPDLATIALDQLQKDPGEVDIEAGKPFALIADPEGNTALITFSTITIPQDKTTEWRLAGTVRTVKLAEHFDDPIADRGRAVLAREPLPLAGKIVYGVRENEFKPTTFYALDLATVTAGKEAAPKQVVADIKEGRIAHNGTVVDRLDFRRLRISDANGRKLAELELNDDVAEFNISPDGQRIVYSTERFVEVPDSLPRREIASIVYSVDGKRLTEVVGYDDCAFMPDGNLLVTGKGGEEGLFIADLKTGKVTPLELKDGPEGEARPRWPRTPVVSPDGKRVAYLSGQDAYVVGIDGRGWTQVWLTQFHEPQTSPVFSPDSKHLAMIVTPLNVMHGPGELIVFDLAKRVRQPLPAAKGANSELPVIWKQ